MLNDIMRCGFVYLFFAMPLILPYFSYRIVRGTYRKSGRQAAIREGIYQVMVWLGSILAIGIFAIMLVPMLETCK